jgi:hypothetical protein
MKPEIVKTDASVGSKVDMRNQPTI